MLYNVRAAVIMYFGHIRFYNITTMVEEIKNRVHDILLGLLGSMSMITIIYYVMVLVLSMMQLYWEINRHMTYSTAFAIVGMWWAQYVVALAALKGLHVVFI
jgi:basic amino acid/polyamine antiporter, APA family